MPLNGHILASRPDITVTDPVPMPRLPNQRFLGDRGLRYGLWNEGGHRRIWTDGWGTRLSGAASKHGQRRRYDQNSGLPHIPVVSGDDVDLLRALDGVDRCAAMHLPRPGGHSSAVVALVENTAGFNSCPLAKRCAIAQARFQVVAGSWDKWQSVSRPWLTPPGSSLHREFCGCGFD